MFDEHDSSESSSEGSEDVGDFFQEEGQDGTVGQALSKAYPAKRRNKHAPVEVSSKKRPSEFQTVVPVAKVVRRGKALSRFAGEALK